jgi:hypothetical protein
MDELLDLRSELDEPLGRYRRKVSHLRGDLQADPSTSTSGPRSMLCGVPK